MNSILKIIAGLLVVPGILFAAFTFSTASTVKEFSSDASAVESNSKVPNKMRATMDQTTFYQSYSGKDAPAGLFSPVRVGETKDLFFSVEANPDLKSVAIQSSTPTICTVSMTNQSNATASVNAHSIGDCIVTASLPENEFFNAARLTVHVQITQ